MKDRVSFSGTVYGARLSAFLIGITFLVGCTPVTDWRPAKTEVRSRNEVPITLVNRGLPFVAIANPDGSQPDARNDARQSADHESYALIDTGAQMSAVSQRFVETQKLERRPEPSLELSDAHYNRLRSHFVVRVPDLPLAGARFKDFDAVVDRSGTLGGPLDIILGRAVFADAVMTIDYPRRKLSFSDQPLPEPNGKDVLSMGRDNRGNMLVPITIDGTAISAVLDTGASSAGTPVTKTVSQRLHWTGPFADVGQSHSWFSSEPVRLGRTTGDLKIGQYTIRRPMLTVTDMAADNFVGSDILRHFIVTIDQRNERVRLTLPPDRSGSNVIETPPLRRLGFGITDAGRLLVQYPSEAAKIGLRDLDRVISVEGIPVDKLTEAHLEQFQERGQPITVRVVREKQPLVFRVPITTIMP